MMPGKSDNQFCKQSQLLEKEEGNTNDPSLQICRKGPRVKL